MIPEKIGMNINQRIQQLRKQMQKFQLAAYLIPSSDPHQSEYVAEHWKARSWISGFTGSAGTLLVTHDEAGLWTDSRYFLQAEKELAGTAITLHKQGIPGVPSLLSWLCQNLHAGSRVGLDGSLFSVQSVRHMQRKLDEHDIHLDYEHDLIDLIWSDRPKRPLSPVFPHPVRLAGLSRAAKLQQVRSQMAEVEASYYLVDTLDDIAWVLNLRGSDVACNPVFIAWLVIGKTSAFLFIDPGKVPKDLEENLRLDGIQLKPYDNIQPFLRNRQASERILMDTSTTHIIHYQCIAEGQRLTNGANIIAPLKACKNAVEIGHIKEAMRKDGVALVGFFRWLEQVLQSNTYPTEYHLAQQLDAFRQKQKAYRGESFSAIVGYQSNGAIVHYKPSKTNSAVVRPEGLLLIDSGGQYLDGTTDITRTIALSPPTADQKRHFTLVLKGHIALGQQRFPAGTTGIQLDTLARQHLWMAGMNYGHGTGHGVGFFLNVHEGPQSISSHAQSTRARIPLEPGMIVSNEPGYYLDGAYGIRIENLILCTQSMKNQQGNFLQFETLTLYPLDTQLIDLNLLTSEEISWVNKYHHQVYEELAPRLDDAARNWLQEKCQSIG